MFTMNLPLLSFYLYTTFKTGIAASGEPRNRGGLVIARNDKRPGLIQNGGQQGQLCSRLIR